MLSARSKKLCKKMYGVQGRVLKSRSSRPTRGRQIKKPFVLAVLALFLATFSIIGVGVFNFIHAPFSHASESYFQNKTIWGDDKTTSTLFVAYVNDLEKDRTIKNFFVFKGDRQSNNYYLYSFPVDEEIEIPESGKSSLRNMYFENNAILSHDQFVNRVTRFMINYLAIEPTGYIVVDKNGYTNIKDKIGDVDYTDVAVALRLRNTLKVPRTVFAFRENAITNLTMGDVYQLLSFFKNTARGGGHVTNLSKYELLDQAKWDARWADTVKMSSAKKDGVKVFILNASKDPKIPGLAAWGSRLSKNIGASIMSTDNSFTDFDQNTIITDDTELPTANQLKSMLDIKKVSKVADLPVNNLYNSEIFRTKVTLVLTNYYK